MKSLVVYDSVYGNTEAIARAIGKAIGDETRVVRSGEANPADLASVDLLIVGSPTQGGKATPAILDFLNKLPALAGVNFAAFDTRLASKFVKLFGFAAGRIAGNLKTKGGNPVLAPEGFFVKGSKGPLKEGELERAASWGEEIVSKMKTRAAGQN